MNIMQTYPCPSCKRPLRLSGQASLGPESFKVFQCDHCTRPLEVGAGQVVAEALTFWLDEATGSLSAAGPALGS